MVYTQREVDLAREHVRDGARRIAEQRRRIAERRMKGLPTDEAEQLLLEMRKLLEQMQAHLKEMTGRD